MVDAYQPRVLQLGPALEPSTITSKEYASSSLQACAESCRRYGISRTAGSRGGPLAEGFEGLHADRTDPITAPTVAEPIVSVAICVPLRMITQDQTHSCEVRRGTSSRTDRIFERHDLITKKRRRSGKPGHPGKPLTPMDEPMRSGPSTSKVSSRCATAATAIPSPSDGFSRFLLECRGRAIPHRWSSPRIHQDFP